MEKNIENLINEFFNNNNDIVTRGKYLILIANKISEQEFNIRNKYMKKFLNKIDLLSQSLIENASEELMDIYLEKEAENKYLSTVLNTDIYLTVGMFDYLNHMIFIGNNITENFIEQSNSNILTLEKMNEILNFLYENYKKFHEFCPFECSFINYVNKSYNSLSYYFGKFNPEDYGYNFFFFNVKNDISPIYVFLHEIGHYIHINITKGKLNINKKILEKIKKTGFSKFASANNDIQKEVFADILAMGIMCDSPYEEYDPFVDITKEDKKEFKKLVSEILK